MAQFKTEAISAFVCAIALYSAFVQLLDIEDCFSYLKILVIFGLSVVYHKIGLEVSL